MALDVLFYSRSPIIAIEQIPMRTALLLTLLLFGLTVADIARQSSTSHLSIEPHSATTPPVPPEQPTDHSHDLKKKVSSPCKGNDVEGRDNAIKGWNNQVKGQGNGLIGVDNKVKGHKNRVVGVKNFVLGSGNRVISGKAAAKMRAQMQPRVNKMKEQKLKDAYMRINREENEAYNRFSDRLPSFIQQRGSYNFGPQLPPPPPPPQIELYDDEDDDSSSESILRQVSPSTYNHLQQIRRKRSQEIASGVLSQAAEISNSIPRVAPPPPPPPPSLPIPTVSQGHGSGMLGGMQHRFKMLERQIAARNQQRIMDTLGQRMNSRFSSAGFGSGMNWGQSRSFPSAFTQRGCSRFY